MAEESRFVYLYTSTKNNADVPVYVGRGTETRPEDHGVDDQNEELAAIIATGEYAIEVLECPNPDSAELVEGALISAMRGRTKVALTNGRNDSHVFVPLGVPPDLAERRTLPAMTPTEIAQYLGKRVLFVYIGPKRLKDPNRGVINLARPDPGAVLDRVQHWWQIKPWVERWTQTPSEAPVAVVGIAGTKHKYVIGSLDVSTLDWNTVVYDGAKVSIPITLDDESVLDGFELRGRTVRDGAIFSRYRQDHARLYDSSGQIERPRS